MLGTFVSEEAKAGVFNVYWTYTRSWVCRLPVMYGGIGRLLIGLTGMRDGGSRTVMMLCSGKRVGRGH